MSRPALSKGAGREEVLQFFQNHLADVSEEVSHSVAVVKQALLRGYPAEPVRLQAAEFLTGVTASFVSDSRTLCSPNGWSLWRSADEPFTHTADASIASV